jgi:hypothetical protein
MSLSMGQSLIGNPLDAEDNSLSAIFNPLSVPNGTMLTKWDAASGQYLPDSIFDGSGWSINYSLPPGEGALLTAPAAFTNLFVGTVLTLEHPSPIATSSSGTYLLSSRAAVPLGPGNPPVFESIIGRAARDGEQFRWMDPTTQLLHTTTYFAGVWNNGLPALNVGQAAFFVLIPEPSTFFSLAVAVVLAFRSRGTRSFLRSIGSANQRGERST